MSAVRALYAGNARAVVGRGLLATRSTNWIIVLTGVFEPVFYLLALGIGLGGYIGSVEDAKPVQGSEDMPLGRVGEIILVVEDEQRVRHFSVDALRELGYTALSAASGIDALRILDEHPSIALLFTDVVMPEMDGRRLADAAREKRPDLRVLYTTGYTRNAVVHNGRLDAGVNLLAKPYSIAQLARKIRAALDSD